MGTTTRHFNALMRKNFINWKRSPCSAACQLICPGMLMLILVYVRSRILPQVFNEKSLALIETPQFQIDLLADGSLDILSTQARMQPFSDYYGLNRIYSFDNLTTNPLNFNPINCGLDRSWVLPKVASPIIAIVGPDDNPVMQRITQYLTALQNYWNATGINELYIQNFTDIQELNTYIASDTYLMPDIGICFGIQVTQDQVNSYSAQLIFDDQQQFGGSEGAGIPATGTPAYNLYTTTPNIKTYDQLSLYGYAFTQNLVANAILQVSTGVGTASISTMNIPLPARNIIIDQFSSILSGIFPLFMILMYMGPVYTTTYDLVKEKEQRSKESMRMMGLNDFPYWLSWFVFYTIQSSIITLIGWLCLCINVMPSGGKGYILLYMWLFGQSIFGQVVFYQALFSRSKYAGLVSVLIFFMLEFLYLPIQTTGSIALKKLLSLVPQVSCQAMAAIWADFSQSQIAITSITSKQIINNYSFNEGLWMYIPAFLLWLLMGLYLDAVLPKQFGSKKHPCFMLFPSTYLGCCRRPNNEEDEVGQNERRSNLLENDGKDDVRLELKNLKPENYEPVAAEVERSSINDQYLRIEGLEKVYENGFKAVDGINVKMYKNQIFALLGQNGAGKSTTIGVLTGLIDATKGSATVFKKDMFKDAEKVRQFMGICPQHDVLFENLTPIEHLSIFYDFKGGKPELKQKEINDLIRDVGLSIDKDKKAGSLSGGNKRKLSVAIALCGGSKLVLLDEPTAGMDLGARRDLWNMLKNYRSDKIVILTTHYMDEADVLGDRIGIMAKGQMMCLGSSLFLKKRFGAGYKITMVKASKKQNTQIKQYLEENLGKVELLSEVSSEIVFQVSSETANNFTQFFSKFDKVHQELGILSYGVSITTLEEVFLKINQEFSINIGNSALEAKLEDQTGQKIEDIQMLAVKEEEINQNELISKESLNDSSNLIQQKTGNLDLENSQNIPQILVGHSTLASTVKALLIKRFHLYKRDRTGLCCEIVVPFICVLIGCVIAGINFSQKSVNIQVAPTLYPTPQRIVMNTQPIFLSANEISPQTLYDNLPGSATQFSLTTGNFINPVLFYNFTVNQSQIGDPQPYRYGSYEIYKSDVDTQTYQFATLVNLTSPLVTAYYPQFMYESLLKSASEIQLNQNTVPFPQMYQLTIRATGQNYFGYAGYVGFAFCFMPCAIISFILLERTESLRHMQLISGMSLEAYWLSNMIADMIKLYIPIFVIMIITKAFNVPIQEAYTLLLLYPPAVVPFTYVTSFLFKTDGQAQIVTLLINYAVNDVAAIMTFVLMFIPSTFKLGGILRWGLCIFPSYCVLNGILWTTSKALILNIRATQPNAHQLSPNNWNMSNLGGDALFLILEFVIYTGLLIAIEKDLFRKLRNYSYYPIPEKKEDLLLDPDVINEEERVRKDINDVIRVVDFRKVYTNLSEKPFLAVERISFGLDYGECFALLGVNGAGKSTTFKGLTADTDPTSGQITVAGFDITSQFEDARKLIGYCPQKDAIFNLMTVEEHLWFYARIKGIPQNMQSDIVEKSIVELNLSDHIKKPAGTLSGGNKRKLSVAMATLGNPPIILLDEPSAGMDPEARRFMWTVVERISQRDKKSAVVLTTHSMEEAEALSTKMGIMVRGGVFKCYGSSQHIKNKYGTGYECEIKIRKPSYQDLQQLALQLNFDGQIEQRILLQEAIQTARSNNVSEMIFQQIKEKGLGSDLIFESSQGVGEVGTVRLSNFVTFIYTIQFGLKVAALLAKHFAQVELIEQCSDFFKFRIPREDKTIGSLFGLIEDQKKECNISEYSVNQTSLEQIFQAFANQSLLEEKASLTFKLDIQQNLTLIEELRTTLKEHQIY